MSNTVAQTCIFPNLNRQDQESKVIIYEKNANTVICNYFLDSLQSLLN